MFQWTEASALCRNLFVVVTYEHADSASSSTYLQLMVGSPDTSGPMMLDDLGAGATPPGTTPLEMTAPVPCTTKSYGSFSVLSPLYWWHPAEHRQNLAPLWMTPPLVADGQPGLTRHDSCHRNTTFQPQGRNRGSENNVNHQLMTHAYWVDMGKKDHGRAFLDKGSISMGPDKDGLTTTDATAPAVSDWDGTYKILSK
jgi:hypothetical protein